MRFKSKCFVIAFGLLAITNSVYSAVFNEIYTPELAKRTQNDTTQRILTKDGHLIFLSQVSNQETQILSLNIDTSEKTPLYSFSPESMNPTSRFFELKNGQIVWQAIDDNQAQLYVSDGNTPFTALSSTSSDFAQEPQIINGMLFFKINNKLVWTDGEEIKQYSAENNSVKPVCAFDIDNFSYHSPTNGNFDTFYNFNDGEVSPTLTEASSIDQVSTVAHTSNACVIKNEYTANEVLHLNHYHLTVDGQHQQLDSELASISAMEEHFIVLAFPSVFTGPHVIKLNPLDLSEVASYTLNTGKNYTIQGNNNGVWVYEHEIEDPIESTTVYFLDEALNLSDGSVRINAADLVHVASKNIDIFISGSDHYTFYQGAFLGIFNENPELSDSIYISNMKSETLLKDNGQIYKFATAPAIGNLMNGPWVDHRYASQGLSINPGKRSDGSEYIFLAYYLYRNGEPLWLAGVSNYVSNQDSISIDLYEFNGASYLDTNPPSSELFGSIELQFTGCSSINGTLNFGNQSKELSFNRVDDASFKHICLEQ